MVNEWTRDDLPVAFEDSKHPGQYWNPSPELMADLAVWLNEHQPKPEPDRWRRAHEIVEGERDLARDRCREAGRERDAAVRVKGEAFDRAVRAERDRDEWKARAEAAEARTAPAVTRDEVWRVVAAHDPGDDEMALCRVNRLTDAVCALFGVEAEQATDPVEELAGQIETATRAAIRQVCDDLADVVPSLDPRAVEQAMEVTAASRKIAAHVLGQEAGQ